MPCGTSAPNSVFHFATLAEKDGMPKCHISLEYFEDGKHVHSNHALGLRDAIRLMFNLKSVLEQAASDGDVPKEVREDIAKEVGWAKSLDEMIQRMQPRRVASEVLV